MKLIKAIIKPINRRQPQGKKETKERTTKVVTVYDTVYLHTIRSYHDDINCVVVVVDSDDNELERRWGKKIHMQDIINKMKGGYKRVQIAKTLRILKEIEIPKNTYTPKEKKEPRNYSPVVYSNHEKFQKALQVLVGCLDEHKMRVLLTYNSPRQGKYIVTMEPKSANMARGIHRIIMKLEEEEYSYFYGIEVTGLELICRTDSIVKLFQ